MSTLPKDIFHSRIFFFVLYLAQIFIKYTTTFDNDQAEQNVYIGSKLGVFEVGRSIYIEI